jgi:CO dehydrogenase nickel-insertion accessory protein CooC1
MSYEEASGGLRIGIVGKGGAGKSTLTVLLAKRLRSRGDNVFVLDADSTNAGLGEALGVDTPPFPLIQHFGGTVFGGGAVTCPVDDPTPLARARLSLGRIPREFFAVTADGILYMVAGKVGRDGPGSGCDGPISKIVRDLRIVDGDRPFLTLIDFKAGLEDVARGVIVGLDQVVVVVDPTGASVRLAADMAESVRLLRSGIRPATRHLDRRDLVAIAERNFAQARTSDCIVVLNRISNPHEERKLRERLGEVGIEPVGSIPTDPRIAQTWLDGGPLSASMPSPAIEAIDRLIARMEASAARPSSRSDLPSGSIMNSSPIPCFGPSSGPGKRKRWGS